MMWLDLFLLELWFLVSLDVSSNGEGSKGKRQMEQMPKGSIHERLAWGACKSEMENQQRKKNKTKYKGLEI